MTPWLDDGDVRLYHGDNLDVLRAMPDRSVHMCATSPPFYGLRDYGTGEWEGGDPDCDHKIGTDRQDAGRTADNFNGGHATSERYAGKVCPLCGASRVDQQIGLEDTPDQWVERLVAVFREVRRVLRDDGTLWVEIGDSYAHSTAQMPPQTGVLNPELRKKEVWSGPTVARQHGQKPKDLIGQPWLLAFALRADGWYLRSEIIWARPNPMPESVTDRPTKSHSTVFLLSKQPRYFYDADAIREPHQDIVRPNFDGKIGALPKSAGRGEAGGDPKDRMGNHPAGANARSVWTIPTQPTPFAHFATWPEALVRRMILAGTSERGCCVECGSPWERVVEQVRDPENLKQFDGYRPRWDTDYEGKSGEEGNPYSRTASGMFADTLSKRREMRGWRPTCACGDFAETKPCTVLDPFAGSATTMLVARNHGRHSIGIELNADYLTIAAGRLQQLSLLA